jgi:hypothetical protein
MDEKTKAAINAACGGPRKSEPKKPRTKTKKTGTKKGTYCALEPDAQQMCPQSAEDGACKKTRMDKECSHQRPMPVQT